jgi:membrane protease YdiL (CAAX protease family)
MIGGILFFILTYIFARHFYLLWLFDEGGLRGYLFFIFLYGGAIVGAILGFRDKNWQIESVKVGRILCFLVGISYPLFYFLASPSIFSSSFFESFLDEFYLSIPNLILFIGSITGMIEWELELRKNKFAQE